MKERMTDSPESIAFRLLQRIAVVEGKSFNRSTNSASSKRVVADRNWILNTYAECLACVKGARPVH